MPVAIRANLLLVICLGLQQCQHQLMTCFCSSNVVLLYNTHIFILACPSNSNDDSNNDILANGLETNVVATVRVAQGDEKRE
jgi:hypothetical protein